MMVLLLMKIHTCTDNGILNGLLLINFLVY